MTRYRVARQTFHGQRAYQAGEEIEYDGIPADNLEPLDDEGRRKFADAQKHFAEERGRRALDASPEATAMGVALVRALKDEARGGPPYAPGAGAGPPPESSGGSAAEGAARDVKATARSGAHK